MDNFDSFFSGRGIVFYSKDKLVSDYKNEALDEDDDWLSFL